MSASQNNVLRSWLLAGKSITPFEAWVRFGISRLGARMWDLRHELPIKTEMVKVRTRSGTARVAQYRLNGTPHRK